RDFFESVRSAAIDADSITRRIQAMESREGVRAQSYEVRGRSSGTGDAMRATDARMDFEGRIERRREEDYRLIDAACSVIYGADQSTGGVGAILGAAYADALWWRFCAAATWPEVAEGAGMSERWCKDAVGVALDVIDSYGIERMASGLGLAEG
ncbi:hypothetical protein, partial [Parafannyhessea umbonata]|uniref:hypothetical protein n=1 Tax=Parafannyhessea umbonata TaxID=604330 RepID=UPI002A813402